MGAKIMLYPHAGGGPNFSWEGLWAPDPRVFANFVTGPGHAEYQRRIDYPADSHVIGWTFCEQRPFRACEDVRNVVFAPWHPNGGGDMTDVQRELEHRGLQAAPRLPLQRDRAPHRHARAERPLGGRRRDLRQRPQVAADGPDGRRRRGRRRRRHLPDRRRSPAASRPSSTARASWPSACPARRRSSCPSRPSSTGTTPGTRSTSPTATSRRSSARPPRAKRRSLTRSAATSASQFNPLEFAQLVERIAREDRSAPIHIDETRSHTTLAFADELIENPALLRSYCETYGPESDASLLLWAPGVNADQLLEMAELAIAAAGVDENRLPDMLLAPLAGAPRIDAALAERADALLSEWPSAGRIGELPRFSPALVTT